MTGGRAPVTLDLARKFNELGMNVFVAESFQHNVTKSSNAIKKAFLIPKPNQETERFIDTLIDIIQREKIDFFIPTCEEIFYISKYKHQIDPYCQVFVDDIEKLKLLHSKWEFINFLKEIEVDFPTTVKVESHRELVEASKGKIVVIKPVYSRFSTNTFILNTKEITPYINVSPANPYVVQEYIDGTQYCSYSIVHQGVIKAHTVYKTTFTAGRGATIAFEHTDHKGIFQIVKKIVEKLRFTGQIAFDFIEDKTGHIYPIECNPRATSGIHLLIESKIHEAFFNQSEKMILPRTNERKMIALAMLLYSLSSKNKTWLKTFLTSKDISFRKNDIKPFFYQFVSMYHLWKIARKEKLSILESSTFDIEWGGE